MMNGECWRLDPGHLFGDEVGCQVWHLKGSYPPHPPQTRRGDLAGAVPQEIWTQTSVGFGVSETARDCRAKVLLFSGIW